LGDIGEIVTGKTPSTSDESLWNGEIQFVTPTDISEEKYQWETQRSVSSHAVAKVLPKHSTMFTCIASIGKMALSVKPCITNQQINSIVPSRDFEPEFVYYSLLSIVSLIKSTQSNSTLPIINKTDFSKIPISVPKQFSEQQKIADCLSSLDELIAAQARKVDTLKTHKKGLMQQLFPREGETQPRLRFPEFRDAREWLPKTLGDACKMQAGKFVSASDINAQSTGGLFPCFGGNGLRGFTVTQTHDGTYPLIGRQGALCGNVKLATGKFHATEHALVVTPNKGVEALWLYYLLDLLNLNRFATGQAQPGLSVDVLEKVPVAVPEDEKEQLTIASCLISLDTCITTATQELETLKTHKKGLMQQLFPQGEALS
jgi:type I restriction enzyme S subunit